eukprot:9249096-Heterocapsa_arctica.AAC.1
MGQLCTVGSLRIVRNGNRESVQEVAREEAPCTQLTDPRERGDVRQLFVLYPLHVSHGSVAGGVRDLASLVPVQRRSG